MRGLQEAGVPEGVEVVYYGGEKDVLLLPKTALAIVFELQQQQQQ